MSEYWGIRGKGKVCCPESDCCYGGFPQQSTCSGCGKKHVDCENYRKEVSEEPPSEEDIRQEIMDNIQAELNYHNEETGFKED